ncbi:MAG: hypothetical protein K1X56_00560 [Flavobacteriales bacterium]|nr:hypothetical protein [Flavobacteriales bacterium]
MNRIKIVVSILAVFVQVQFGFGHAMNGKSLPTVTGDSFSFFVSGHFHGSSNNTTGHPAKTITSNLQKINADSSLFLIHLGDFFLDVKNDIPNYTSDILNPLRIPLYNAVGNHDLSSDVYQKNYGATWFSMVVGRWKFIILDTELNDGSIEGEQLDFLKSELNLADSLHGVFLFAHRLIWAEEHPQLKDLFTDNTRGSHPSNYRKDILPLLEQLSATKKVCFMGGSMGNVPTSFFVHREGNIQYVATAIRDTPRDALLKVNIKGDQYQLESFPLAMSPEFYDLDYYAPHKVTKPAFNWRLVPLYTKQAIGHRYFWYGVICLLLPLVLIRFMFKRRKK